MDFFLENWILISIAVFAAAMLLWPALVPGARGNALSPEQAVQWMNREKALVIDVCSAEEFAAGHILGAKNLPLESLSAKLPGTVKNKSAPLLLTCASGVRSGRALAEAKKLGYENLRSLAGGMRAWRSANLPVEKKT
ncbi:rhodanese-like domain-containing protein [Hydrogenophaga sp.]|uniref:rhodanese-like domain-containing protein n=1 Tax=Hydrogenophaga sp. TaxID=1904254 RepID=UPI0019CF0C97|nr:rhodanese-like domain-containing protein [Hydrogenophaga sp.]MBD3893959.1 rhodanese-like domain-containing protein [Hydrogenophaga sp.]